MYRDCILYYVDSRAAWSCTVCLWANSIQQQTLMGLQMALMPLSTAGRSGACPTYRAAFIPSGSGLEARLGRRFMHRFSETRAAFHLQRHIQDSKKKDSCVLNIKPNNFSYSLTFPAFQRKSYFLNDLTRHQGKRRIDITLVFSSTDNIEAIII